MSFNKAKVAFAVAGMLMLLLVQLPQLTGRAYALSSVLTPIAHRPCTGLGPNPTPLGGVPQPYLKIPFSRALGKDSLLITNGWLMASDEIPIAGNSPHRALDFEFTRSINHGYAFPIFAATSGCAYYTYQYIAGYEPNPTTGVLTQYGLGAGLVIEVRDAQGFVEQYIHLSVIRPGIPYVGASPVNDPMDPEHPDWSPTGLFQPAASLFQEGVQVDQGELLGLQGDTGIGMNWKDNFSPTSGIVLPRNREMLPPWDPPQLHFQVYQGRNASFQKQNILDPMGLYKQIVGNDGVGNNPYTPAPSVFTPAPTNNLFLEGSDGALQYAAP